MEGIPSANLRQQKLDQQRKLIEEKQRKKRQQQVSLWKLTNKSLDILGGTLSLAGQYPDNITFDTGNISEYLLA